MKIIIIGGQSHTKNHENTVKRRTFDNEGQIGESQQTSTLSYMIFLNEISASRQQYICMTYMCVS